MNMLWERLCAWIVSLWTYIVSLWSRFRKPLVPQVYRAIRVESDEQLPKQLSIYTVYIVGLQSNEWLAEMICPCGCDQVLYLNLLQDELPNWKWRVAADGTVTLSPSVWRKVGCKSHFFLREGAI